MASNKLFPKTTISETEKNESSSSPENIQNIKQLPKAYGDNEGLAELMDEEDNQEKKQATKKKSARKPVKFVTKPSSKKGVKTILKTGIKPIISGKKTIRKVKTGTNCAPNARSKSAKVSSKASLNKAPVRTVKKISVKSTNSQPTSKAISATTVKPIQKILVAKKIITASPSKKGPPDTAKKPNLSGTIKKKVVNTIPKKLTASKPTTAPAIKSVLCGTEKQTKPSAPENIQNIKQLPKAYGDNEGLAELMDEEDNQEKKQATKKKSARKPVKFVTKPSSKKGVKTILKTGIKPIISGKKTIRKVKTGTNCAPNARSKSAKVSSKASLNKAPVRTVKKISVKSTNSQPTSKAISATTVKPIQKILVAKKIITASPSKKGPPDTAKKPNLSGTIKKKVVNTIPKKLTASKPTTAPAIKSVLCGTEKQTKPSAGLSKSVKISGLQKKFEKMNISKTAPENKQNIKQLLKAYGDNEGLAEVMDEEDNQEKKQAPENKQNIKQLLKAYGDNEGLAEVMDEEDNQEKKQAPENIQNIKQLPKAYGDNEWLAELMDEEDNQEKKQATKKKSARKPVKFVTKPSSKKGVKTILKTGIKPIISGKKTIRKVKTGTNCAPNARSKSAKVSSKASLNKAPVRTVKKISVKSTNSQPTSKAISATTVKPIQKILVAKKIITASPSKKGPPDTAKKPNLSGTIKKKVVNTIPKKLTASKPTTAPAIKSVLCGTEKQTKPSAGLSKSVKISGLQKKIEKMNISKTAPENKQNIKQLLKAYGDNEGLAEVMDEEDNQEKKQAPENIQNIKQLPKAYGDNEGLAELMDEEDNQEKKQATKKKSARKPVKFVTKPSSKKGVKTILKTGIKPIISGKKTIRKVKTGTNCAPNARSKSAKVSSKASLNKAPVRTVKKISVKSTNSQPTSKAISATTVKPIQKILVAKKIITASPSKKGPPDTAKKPNLSGTIKKKVVNTIPKKLTASKPTTAPAIKSVLCGTEKQTKPSAGLSKSVKISGLQKKFEKMNISKTAPENKQNIKQLLKAYGDNEGLAEVMDEEDNQEKKQAPENKQNIKQLLKAYGDNEGLAEVMDEEDNQEKKQAPENIQNIKQLLKAYGDNEGLAELMDEEDNQEKKQATKKKSARKPVKFVMKPSSKKGVKTILKTGIKPIISGKKTIRKVKTGTNCAPNARSKSAKVSSKASLNKPPRKKSPVSAKMPNLTGTITKNVINTIPKKLIASKPTTASAVKSVLRGTEKQTKPSD